MPAITHSLRVPIPFHHPPLRPTPSSFTPSTNFYPRPAMSLCMGNRHAFCNPEVTDNPKKLFVCGLPVLREGPAAPPAWLLPVRKFELACVEFHFQITSSFCCNSAAISPQ